MRIICWNMQKLQLEDHGMSRTIAGLIDQWNADVLIMLEPPSGLCGDADRTIQSGRGGMVWTVKTFAQRAGDNHAQREGRMAVASHPGVAVESLAALNPYDHPNYARQLRILGLTKGDERVRVATCHAPFDEGGVAIVEYVRRCVPALRDWMHNHAPIDVWLGDLNTAGVHSPDAETWLVKCARPTTNKGRGAPRDKVLVRSGALTTAVSGRIVSQLGATGVGDGDVPTSAWHTATDVPSDHVPIYIDTTGVGAALPAAAAAVAPAAAAPAAAAAGHQSLSSLMRQIEKKAAKDAMDVDK